MAVYTQLTEQEIEVLLEHYHIGKLKSFKGITEGVTNTNYLLETDQGQFILTLFEQRFKLDDLPYYVELMQWWSDHGVTCPHPVKMKDGRRLGVLREKPSLIVTFLEGAQAHRITLDHMAELGKLVANMHIAGMEFPHKIANGLSLAGWQDLIDATSGQLDMIEPGLRKLVSDEYNFLSEHWPENLPAGPVHADLFPDNVFFIKPKASPKVSGVIDCYFSCNDFWAYDLAICVNAWCFDDRHRLVPERLQALMESYNDIRPMTPEEDAAFPLLLRGAAMRFLLTRSYDWLNREENAHVTYKDPLEYAAKLRFHQEYKPQRL